ncbi:hypothetical protein ABIA45_001991 [Bradyrhizobium sp. USDA 336]
MFCAHDAPSASSRPRGVLRRSRRRLAALRRRVMPARVMGFSFAWPCLSPPSTGRNDRSAQPLGRCRELTNPGGPVLLVACQLPADLPELRLCLVDVYCYGGGRPWTYSHLFHGGESGSIPLGSARGAKPPWQHEPPRPSSPTNVRSKRSRPMPQHNDDITDASPMPALPTWLRHPHQHAPDRLAKMLDHMARVRSLPDRQATLTTPAARAVRQSRRGDSRRRHRPHRPVRCHRPALPIARSALPRCLSLPDRWRANRKRARPHRHPLRARDNRPRHHQGLCILVRMVRAARLRQSLGPRLARTMAAPGRLLVLARRHRCRAHPRRIRRSPGDASLRPMVRL